MVEVFNKRECRRRMRMLRARGRKWLYYESSRSCCPLALSVGGPFAPPRAQEGALDGMVRQGSTLHLCVRSNKAGNECSMQTPGLPPYAEASCSPPQTPTQLSQLSLCACARLSSKARTPVQMHPDASDQSRERMGRQQLLLYYTKNITTD